MAGMTELDAILAVLARRRAGLVNVGHGRDEDSRRRATSFLDAWEGEVGVVVSWPSDAASWLRPARRFAAGAPDAWVVADTAAGWAGFGRRLAETVSWEPGRTVAFAGLADPSLPLVVGRAATDGVCGAFADGGLWRFAGGLLHIDEEITA
jgi:hypothetical protein